MGFHHTRAARERRMRDGRKYSAYEGAVRMLRSLSMMHKPATSEGVDDALTSQEAPTKTRAGNLVISIDIDKEAQDRMIRRKRKSLAFRLKERIMMMRRVKPEPVTEEWDDSDDEEGYGRTRRGGCFGC